MTAEQRLIGEATFYQQVGGPDAMIPQDAGAPVILRLLAIQVRDALRVNPARLDRKTKDLINSVDAFYRVNSNRRFSNSATPGQEAHPARQIFEISGLPQEMLLKTREELDKELESLRQKGPMGKLLERVIRERHAAKLARTVVATKTDIIFGFTHK